mmetsp:Transcript_39565/g.77319  ORF Transcript_39565/g.77319 Transcript_39565/m.77319 type:complete len:479 (+) Transcript_39565:154-1590(+)|eukprot:CAMPEP_0194306544 /NCGR_PEP_ID=MMETSP0171-20130528/3653_1 /TAXON_ID=218684 /ORGANISM="Corethron pennatum, Strain L29A3" /LENGTH=478 /DNA_ID=CAMNT_0039058339 /DNA_START=93 /DNA_END=1529 /DNA_ORIENTATION=-
MRFRPRAPAFAVSALVILAVSSGISGGIYVRGHKHEHGENCGCAHKHQQQAARLIPDPHETAPATFDGQPARIPDPASEKPADWDEEDDGPWVTPLVPNPAFAWTPRLVPNPAYVSLASKVGSEVAEAVPWVTLGVLLVAALSVFPLPFAFLRSQLADTGAYGLVKAALLGLATPLCACGSLPVAAGFVDCGIPLSAVVAFLTASQSAGIDSFFITYGLLGPVAAISRLVGALILAIVAGLSLSSTNDKSVSKLKKSPPTNAKNHATTSHDPGVGVLSQLLETATDIFPLTLLGLVLSTAASHYLPALTSPFWTLGGHAHIREFLLRVGVLASALPLQLCEHTTVTLAAGVQKAGASAGLAFALLLAAPATNLPSLLFLARSSGACDRLTPVRVAVALAGTALVLSYGVDYWGVDMLIRQEAESESDMVALPELFIDASPWIAGSMLVAGIVRKLKMKWTQENECAACPSACESKKDN